MKSTNYLLALTLFFTLFSSCGPTTEEAIRFNDDIIEEQKAVIDRINVLESAIGKYDPEKIEPALKASSEQIEISLDILKKMPNIDEENDFLAVTIELIEMFKSQVANEYRKIMEQYKLPEEEYSESATNELIKSIDDSYNAMFEKFNISQQKLANKYNFEIEGEIEETIE